MVKIRLFCAGGMSTSLLAKKMKAAAEKKGIEVDIAAAAVDKMREVADVDVALLGPQTRFKLDEAKEIFDAKDIPVDVIPMMYYGMVDGDKTLDFALGLMNK